MIERRAWQRGVTHQGRLYETQLDDSGGNHRYCGRPPLLRHETPRPLIAAKHLGITCPAYYGS